MATSTGTAGTGETSPGLTGFTTIEGSTVVSMTVTGLTSEAVSETTTKRCEEMQAVDEAVSKKITVTPNELPTDENVKFQPTNEQGVSFDETDHTPTITVYFEKPAQVQSVTLPRAQRPNANVQQFQVTFYSPEGNKINEKPILSSSSPMGDNSQPAQLDYTQIPSNTPVSRLEITIVSTTDNRSPKGVVLDIKACTEETTG